LKTVLRKAFAQVHVLVYRMTAGRLVDRWGKAKILLLTTEGRKTGRERTTPLLYLEDAGSPVVVATNDGAARHPSWYLNIAAQPDVKVQVRGESFVALARTATDAERAALWPRLVAIYPNYERDQTRTERRLPVVILERAGR
jgi:proline iminopeptidase